MAVILVALYTIFTAFLGLHSLSNTKRPVRGIAKSTTETDNPILVPSFQDIDDARTGKPLKSNLNSLVYSGSSADDPKVVLVVDIDFETRDPSRLAKVLDNRRQYAQKHGYGLYARFKQDFHYQYPSAFDWTAWTKIALCREAMVVFPNAKYYWYLDQDAVITDLSVDVQEHVLNRDVLEQLMLADQPVITSSKVIRTPKQPNAQRSEFVVAQDEQGLNSKSFMFTNSDSSRMILDLWNDPNHHNYGPFDRNDISALNHIALWHYTVLRHMAIIPPKRMASLSWSLDDKVQYSNGDFVGVLRDCNNPELCAQQFESLLADVHD